MFLPAASMPSVFNGNVGKGMLIPVSSAVFSNKCSPIFLDYLEKSYEISS